MEVAVNFTGESVVGDEQTSGSIQPTVLDVQNLNVEFHTPRGVVRAVEGISFSVRRGEILAIVGESGCGKSVTAHAIMRLLPGKGSRVSGRVMFDGRDLLSLSAEDMRKMRGRDVAMVFQEPMTCLNPVLTIGYQIIEPLFIHGGANASEARVRAIELLNMVGLTDPERRLQQYPHELSGGMRQRVMIAIGLACQPKLIIADEPTTALDVTIQAQILELLKDLSRRLNIATVIITHNLGVVARYAHRVNVMYAGQIVENGETGEVFLRPRHPYTLGLLRSIPRLDQPQRERLETIDGAPPDPSEAADGCRFAPRCALKEGACAETSAPSPSHKNSAGHWAACLRASRAGTQASTPQAAARAPAPAQTAGEDLITVENLSRHFKIPNGLFRKPLTIRAVDGVSFRVRRGETLGLVGESGCGKSTAGRCVLRLDQPSGGRILFDGADITHASEDALRPIRRRMQVIFQDPFSSLNPRMKVGRIIAEPIYVHGLAASRHEAAERARELLAAVGLPRHMADRWPHEMSGGQRQRVGVARALAMNPDFIVCDEPVSALDASIQGQIVNLLQDLGQSLGLTYLFIAHDLAVVRHLCDRIMVMYLGKVMECAGRDSLCRQPLHPYTRALLDAVPIPDPEAERRRCLKTLQGEIPSPLNPPLGCVFHTRCPHATAQCRETPPDLREAAPGHLAACHNIFS